VTGFHWYHGDCPNCHRENQTLQQHSLSVWCLSCGWGRNRFLDPGTGRPIARWGLLGDPAGRRESAP
jgi:hypothetical protein